MSRTRRTGRSAGGESGATTSELPAPNLPRSSEEERDAPGLKHVIARVPDYDDDKLKDRWKKIINRQRKELETDVLQISKPRAKLDTIAKGALDVLRAKLIKGEPQWKESGTDESTTPDGLDSVVRAYIVEKGIASEVKRVTQRLNARRMTDGRRWVLSATYVYLLAKLFQDKEKMKPDEFEELMGDDLGVAEKILLDLEEKDGPLDVFAALIVKEVMDRNRISKSKTLMELVSQQVRGAI